MKKITLCLVLFCSFVFGSTAFSEDSSAQLLLARSAGSYLGIFEYIRVFKYSNCGYTMPKSFPSVDEVLVSEVIPVIQPEYRDEIKTSLISIKPELSKQANEIVSGMIASARKDYDDKTACGVAASIMGDIHGRASQKWESDKAKYGWKESKWKFLAK
ncbi:hypothetical protein QZJ86_13860 [Methylomonas montana]|uniref:hypothetical protein n=1 Tax=Methylomonas montana TaxID=3058963 RepID=UPI0026586BE0|nr:hypothetical protein [Methylomonas montana]WKJ89104.1 hypothetical protein QZJ86_13860 [Methylomonas montana]